MRLEHQSKNLSRDEHDRNYIASLGGPAGDFCFERLLRVIQASFANGVMKCGLTAHTDYAQIGRLSSFNAFIKAGNLQNRNILL